MTEEAKTKPGDSKGRRECPALKGTITAADCGAQRGSKLDCPPLCPHYPLGTAALELWFRVEASWMRKTLEGLIQHLGMNHVRKLTQASQPDKRANPSDSALYNVIHGGLIHERNDAGKTLAELWEAAGWPGLNNDERVMMQSRRRSFLTVIEVKKVLDRECLECIDVFATSAAPLIVFDPNLTRRAYRFSRYLVWVTPYPRFSRLGGAIYEIDSHIWPAWKRAALHLMTEAAQQQPGLTFPVFLSRNYSDMIGLVTGLLMDFRQRVLASIDLHQCLAKFKLTGSVADLQAVLQGRPEFQPFQPASTSASGTEAPVASYLWLRRGESADCPDPRTREGQGPPSGDEPIGHLFLFADSLQLETNSKQQYAFLRQKTEQYLAGLVTFELESVVNMVEQMARHKEAEQAIREAQRNLGDQVAEANQDQPEAEAAAGIPPTEASAVPASALPADPLAEKNRQVEAQVRLHFEGLLTRPIAFLEGSTLREAAQKPELRSQLVEFMKDQLNDLDRQNRRNGTSVNVDWVLDELGLAELK